SCDDGSILNGTGTSEAWDACNNLSLAGKSWRVPTKDELKLLIECNDKTMPNDNDSCGEGNYPSNSLVPAVNCLFEDDTISSYNYWSSSAHSTYSYFAWLVQFGSGYNFSFNKNYIGYVRCVSE
ncbi:MAG: DUF1566 domain-containing protein, partial [Leptospiraceae bacterium]|nr:DUF1566 domain-containing protein [Leptospiraceae bacterium]